MKIKIPKIKIRRRMRAKISLLVPLSTDSEQRNEVWKWLARYWRCNLPGVEIVIGRDRAKEDWDRHHDPVPFSKTAAVNDAFKRSHGDIIVILDADAYLRSEVIEECAERIRDAREDDIPLWFVPYETIYRLNEYGTQLVMAENPCYPMFFPVPPPAEVLEDAPTYNYPGHKYGAMIQVMPREAFELVGGMDCRFRGWGGEDISFLCALDTLFAPHKTLPGEIYHMWHPRLDRGRDHRGWRTRVWAGQKSPQANDRLAGRYVRASGQPEEMRRLADEGAEECQGAPWWVRLVNFWTCR